MLALLVALGSLVGIAAAQGLDELTGSTEATVTRPEVSPPSRGPVAGPAERIAPAEGATEVEHGAVVVDGQEWLLTTYMSRLGELCAAQTVPGEGQGVTCFEPESVLLGQQLRTFVGARQESGGDDLTQWDHIWIWGFVASKISTIEILMTDCSKQTVASDSSGIFLFVTPRATVHDSKWPYLLRALDPLGNVVVEENVLDKMQPPDTDEATAASVSKPAPAAPCAD